MPPPRADAPPGHRWRWLVLLAAVAAAIAGFWGAGRADGDLGTVGLLAVPLFWAAGYLTRWWALPVPPLTLVAGVALGGEAGSNDNEFAWMSYVIGLLLCQTAVVWGLAQRRRADRSPAIGPFPERPSGSGGRWAGARRVEQGADAAGWPCRGGSEEGCAQRL